MTGTDIIEINRIKKAIKSKKFFERVYTKQEQNYINSKANTEQTAAGIFCLKESVVKALGTGFTNGINFNLIEVNHDDLGKPIVKLYGKAKQLFQEKKYKEIGVSISHCKAYAVAYCVLL